MADPISATVGGIIQAIMTAIGESQAAGDDMEAQALYERATKLLSNIELPQLDKAIAEQLGPSAFEKIKTNATLQSAQMDALGRLAQISDEGGLTLSDRAAMNQIMGELAQRDAASRAATREEMQARGTLGAGAELASRLAGQQQTAQLASQRGMDIAGQAQQRALDAIMQRGALAGDIRGQEFNEQSAIAQAKDAINRYNAGAKERAQMYNLDLPQRQFQNTMNLRGMQYGGMKEQGSLAERLAQQKRQAWANYSKAGGDAGEAATNLMLPKPKPK